MRPWHVKPSKGEGSLSRDVGDEQTAPIVTIPYIQSSAKMSEHEARYEPDHVAYPEAKSAVLQQQSVWTVFARLRLKMLHSSTHVFWRLSVLAIVLKA